jgi:hypothetical protein
MTSHLQIPKVAPTIPKLPEHPRSQKRFPVDPHNNRGRRPMNYSRASSITQVPKFYRLQKEFTPPSFLRKTLDIPRHPTPKILASKAQTKEVQNEASRPQPILQFGTPHIKFLVLCVSWGVFGKVSPCPDSSWETVTNHKISFIPL